MKLRIQRPDDKKVAKAILKAGYLISFINWGYDFVFSSNAQLLRDYLDDKEQDPLNLVPFWIDKKNAQKDELPLGLCIIENPVEMQTFVVNVPMKIEGYSSIASVLIPYAGSEGWKRIKEVNEFLKINPTVTITFTRVQSPMTANIFDGYSKSNDKLLTV